MAVLLWIKKLQIYTRVSLLYFSLAGSFYLANGKHHHVYTGCNLKFHNFYIESHVDLWLYRCVINIHKTVKNSHILNSLRLTKDMFPLAINYIPLCLILSL